MSDNTTIISPLKQALISVEKMQRRIEELENEQKEPIAVIGMGCRFNACSNVDEFWDLLINGKEGIGEIPKSRWNIDEFYDEDYNKPGKMNIRRGGFIEDIDKFDANFFNISPREAERMDPQQRILLEVIWEMFENNGILPNKMRSSNTGVFVGVGSIDYSQYSYGDYSSTNSYTGIGNSSSIAANRISYFFDFLGPSVSLDTACSSGLVAVHLALKSLQNGECNTAIAAGVNLILSPDAHLSFSKAQMMASDGKCKTFDSAADGYVRSEGCASVLLKRLSDAEKDGDTVLAVIRGSAVNQDGRSNGITAPNKQSQVKVIRDALKNANLDPNEVGYIEAHGTGTKLGDPIEVQALTEVFKNNSNKIFLGAVKSNIGHTEIAAGLAGLIKAILSINHEIIPRNLNFKDINPLIPINEIPFHIPTENVQWKRGKTKRIAGISSFGFGGTNSHLIVEEPTHKKSVQNVKYIPDNILSVSAKSEDSLRNYIRASHDFLSSNNNTNISDYCYSANIGRTQFEFRKAFVSDDLGGMVEKLSEFLSDENIISNSESYVNSNELKTAFLFTGQGAQYYNMAADLYSSNEYFKEEFDRCNEILKDYLDIQIKDIIFGNNDKKNLIDQTLYTQPALFVIEYCLASLWQSWGITPDYLLGHSIGEYVAAAIANVFSLEDALYIVANRARLMQSLPMQGDMAVIFSDYDKVREIIFDQESEISIAAANGPSNTVISGEKSIIANAIEKFNNAGIKSRKLIVSHAFHSKLMDPILDEFERIASKVNYSSPKIPIVSNVTGKLFTNNFIPDEKYWRKHIRNTVFYASGISELDKLGVKIFLEIGPKPVLITMGQSGLPDSDAIWLPSLNAGKNDWKILLNSLSQLFEKGCEINWGDFYSNYRYNYIKTPTYPFNRIRYWIDRIPSRSFTSGDIKTEIEETAHPLIGKRLNSPLIHDKIVETYLSADKLAIIRDHNIFGMKLFPAMAYPEMILAGVKRLYEDKQFKLSEINLLEGIKFNSSPKIVQTVYENSDECVNVKVYSIDEDLIQKNPVWELNATAKIIPIETSDSDHRQKVNIKEIKKKCEEFTEIELDIFSKSMLLTGFEHGKSMQIIRNLWSSGTEALGWFTVDESTLSDASRYLIHPSITDAGTQIFAAIMRDNPDYQSNLGIFLPIFIESFRIYKTGITSAWGHASLVKIDKGEGKLISNLKIFGEDGEIFAEISGINYQYTSFSKLIDLFDSEIKDWFYKTEWIEQDTQNIRSNNDYGKSNWLIIGGNSEISEKIHAKLNTNKNAVLVNPGSEFKVTGDLKFEFNPLLLSDYNLLFNTLKQKYHISINKIIYLSSFDLSFNIGKNVYNIIEIHEKIFKRLILFTKKLLNSEFSVLPKIWFVTKNIYSIEGDSNEINLAQAPINGFFNSLDMELPDYNFIRIDLKSGDDNLNDLLKEISLDDDERRILYRDNKRYTERLIKISSNGKKSDIDQPKYLDIDEKGILDNLKFVPAERIKPDREMVEIKVRATGLNFRDVLNALDLYPGDAGLLGGECSGIVSAIGENVTDFKVGDEVLGIASGSFGTYVQTHHNLVVKKPSHLTFEEAATIPIPFLTAYYSLCNLGKIKNGDNVLVHAASGGVGLASIQIAKLYGATVFGTASTEDKQDVLRNEGVELIMNSRTLEFADEVIKHTEGKGVDLVLNSLTGDFIEHGLKIVTNGGSFLEIGKIDIWDDDLVKKFREDISYHRIAIDDLSKNNSTLIKKLLNEIIELFESHQLKPIRHKVYPIEDVKSAFRLMSSAKHIGKIVVSQSKKTNLETDEPNCKISDNSSYLITGGKGALGIISANWLIRRGAKNIFLISRNDPDVKTQNHINSLEKNGVKIFTYNVDISNYDELEIFIKKYFVKRTDIPELKGIIHSAGVLNDSMIFHQDWEKFESVFNPKVKGAWNLSLLTENMNLDFTIYFSSISSIIGSPGQSNYAAANFFLDSLSRFRNSKGQPTICINWGPWSNVGMAARSSSTNIDSNKAIGKITPSQGKYFLNEIFDRNHTQTGILPVNWEEFKTNLKNFGNFPFFSKIIDFENSEDKINKIPVLIEKLNNSAVNDHFDVTRRYLKDIIQKILGIKDDSVIKYNKPLSELGIDSLLGLEIKKSIDSAIGIKLPATLVFNYPTIDKISEFLLSDVLNEKVSSESMNNLEKEISEDESDKMIDNINELSDAEAEKLLLDKLNSNEFDDLVENE